METTKRTKSEENRDQYTVVLEDLRSQFKVFGEGLQAVRKKGDETFEAVGELKEDVAVLKEDVTVLKQDMQEVKEELHLIRNELKEKVSRDEFLALEHRVSRLEKSARAA
jgi:predicted  nucleic acid-binding Zn-ribbon protein